jgi:cytidylate kinase
MKVGLLTPNLERRLNTLININDRKTLHNDLESPTITLSREFGCEAYPLANELKKRLDAQTGKDWQILDKELIKKISSDKKLSENFLEHIGDSSRFMDFMASFGTSARTHNEAYQIMVEYIVKMAMQGNCIIVGRGAALVTQDLENCTHYRIEAPFTTRVESIARRMNLSYDDAKDKVVQRQTEREKFIKDFFAKDIRDIKYYNAIFNGEKMSVETMASIIIEQLSFSKKHKSMAA